MNGTTSESRSESQRSLAATTGSIAIATLVSRFTGFGKQILLLTVLGGPVASAFTVASQIPNMISELVLGAVLTAIVVPVLVRAEKEDADHGAAFIRRLFTAACLLLGIAAVVATACAPILTEHVFLTSDGEVNTALTAALAFLLLPGILFYGLTALLIAVLNTKQNFRPGAWAPVVNNLVVLAVLGIFWLVPGDLTDSAGSASLTNPKLLLLGGGVLFGVISQVVVLIPALRRAGVSLRPLWGFDARLRQFAGMAAAIVVYVLISQLGFIVATRVSSAYDAAGPAIYNNAWLLLQLPYGVIGVTVLTAIMPRLSRNAADGDDRAVVDDLTSATRLTLVALIPVLAFLTAGGPLVGEALYGYGNFTADAGRLGHAVRWSAFTLVPYALVLLHLRVFYARHQAWIPTWIILGIVAVKVTASLATPYVAETDRDVVSLLGTANGLGFVAGALIGGVLLHRQLGSLKFAASLRAFGVVSAASVVGAGLMLIADAVLRLEWLSVHWGAVGAVLRVGIGAGLCLGSTGALLYLAGLAEIRDVVEGVRRKLSRGAREDVAHRDAAVEYADGEDVPAAPPGAKE